MKLVFPTTFDYPTRFAHPMHGLAMARAFARLLGNDFLFTHGQVVDITLLNGISARHILGPWSRRIKKMHLRSIVSFFWLAVFLIKHKEEPPTFYVIDRAIVFLLIFLRPFFRLHLIFEYHAFYYNWLDRLILHKTDALIFLTHALEKKAHLWSSFTQKAIVLPEGIDLEPYERLSRIPADELRKKLNLPSDQFLVGYIGRFRPLNMDKGIAALVSAASEMSPAIHIYCVGGAKDELAFYKNMAEEKGVTSRITFLPFVDPLLVPEYARAFDALVYIPPANDFFSYYTSPMKFFEYMAAGKPIVASDLPAFREILDEQSAYFIPPADAKNLISAIHYIIANRDEAKKRAEHAREQARQYSWNRRAEAVIKLCKNL